MINLEKYKRAAKEMLTDFCDAINIDGEAIYGTSQDCDIYMVKLEENTKGQYIPPGVLSMAEMVRAGMTPQQMMRANELGLILINRDYYTEEDFDPIELLDTVAHEMIHSKRTLLIYDYYREINGSKRSQQFNTQAYTYQKPPKKENEEKTSDKEEQNEIEYSTESKNEEPKQEPFDLIYTTTKEMAESYADASQGILKGKIHVDDQLMKEFYEMSTDDYSEYEEKNQEKRKLKMRKQQEIDEALVTTMELLAGYLVGRGDENTDIWKIIDKMVEIEKGTTVGTMCKIIQKHHDFELFYWMIDPIGYSEGDIHYDFFNRYTQNDQDLLEEFFHVVTMANGEFASKEFGKITEEEKVRLVKEVEGDENLIPPKKPDSGREEI